MESGPKHPICSMDQTTRLSAQRPRRPQRLKGPAKHQASSLKWIFVLSTAEKCHRCEDLFQ